MTTFSTTRTEYVATTNRPQKRPKVTVFAAVVQILFALVPAPAGFFFSLAEGGGWAAVGAPLFALAVPLWLYGGIGTLRGSRRAHRVGVGMLLAMTAFGVYKIGWVHERASIGFEAITLAALWAQLSASTRAWARD
jgi:hypothetical protein